MRFLLTVFLIFSTLNVSALPLNESENLQRILLEIQAVNPLIEEAQRRTDRQDRLRFNYRCLITDLNLLKHGLRAAVYAVKHQSRQYQGLCGDYGFSGQLGGESEMLSMLQNELRNLKPMITEAKRQVDHSLRQKMNYQALEGDLDTIIFAIQNALIGSGEQARKVTPVRGGFSR